MTTPHTNGGISYTTIGPYIIIGKIGQGGMATVYRAYHKMGGHAVALKVLSAHLSDQQEFRIRFEREAHVLLQFEHPHILPVYDYGEDGEDAQTLYLVMQLLDGRSLAGELTEKPLPREEIGRYTRQVASALDYAHARGIIHRDIKPSNILLDTGNVPLLADFGVAYTTATGDRLTSAGTFVGTVAYASPEQCRGEPLDRRSDIYALAVLVFQMATGRLPFVSISALAIIKLHLTEKPPNPLAFNPALPLSIYAVLFRGLAKNPADRYPSAMKFSEAVDAALSLHVLPAADSSEDWLVGDISPVTFDDAASDHPRTDDTTPAPPHAGDAIPLPPFGTYRPTEEATAPAAPPTAPAADKFDTGDYAATTVLDDITFDDDITLDDDFTTATQAADPLPAADDIPFPPLDDAPPNPPHPTPSVIRPLTIEGLIEKSAARHTNRTGIAILILVVLTALIVIALTLRSDNATRYTTRDDPTLGVTFDYPEDWTAQVGFAAVLTDEPTATVAISDQPVLVGESYASARLVIVLQQVDPVAVYNVPPECQSTLEAGPQETFVCMAREGYTTPVYEDFATEFGAGIKLPGTLPPTPASIPAILLPTGARSWLAVMIVHWNDYDSAQRMLDDVARSVR